MGVDTKFFTNIDVEPRRVEIALKSMQATNIKTESTNSPGYYQIYFILNNENRCIHFHFNSQYFGMTVNLLSMGASGCGPEVMKKLAQIFGGIYQEQDYDNSCEMFERPGEGNIRWSLEEYYSQERPDDRGEDFIKYLK